MSLTSVKMSEDVWLTCLTHALSTETEEIMGLLLGDVEYLFISQTTALLISLALQILDKDVKSKNGDVTVLIWGASPQTRSDRRKDRVETNPEQLAAASLQAERMTISTGRTTRVIGWYHSHPHITVLPSHVDVRTQAMYQLLDAGFIGLIFSCFSEDTNKVGRIQVIAFQSSDGKQNNVPRPISLSPINRSPVINLESSSSSDASLRSGSTRIENLEQDTGDSRSAGVIKGGGKSSDLGGFFANADANYLGRERTAGTYPSENRDNAIVDMDPMDMSESMQEAMHRSNLDMSGAEYVRKEVPLLVLPSSSLLKLDSPLVSFTDLQRVLYKEEQGAYNQAILQNSRDGKVHPLTFIHHTSTYQASMCKLMEYCLSPAISALQDRLRENEIRMAMLSDEAKILEAQALRGSEPNSGSPRNLQAGSPRNIQSSHGPRGSPFGKKDTHSTDSANTRSVSGTGSRSRKGSS